MKKLLVLAALSLLLLPSAAFADSITFTAPTTAGNGNSSTRNPNNSDYEGGTAQFDLDHHRAYAWRINNVVIPAGQTITGATLTFRNISNWDTNANMLFVHLMNTANSSGVSSVVDASGSPVPSSQISDYFAGANALGPSPGANNTFLFSRGFNQVGQGTSPYWAGPGNYTARDFTWEFTPAQLAALALYINSANGNNLAFGFDPDCHFWNNGIVFTIHHGATSVPEPATLALLGTGLMSTGFYLRRRRQAKTDPEK